MLKNFSTKVESPKTEWESLVDFHICAPLPPFPIAPQPLLQACFPNVGQHARGGVCGYITDPRFKSWEVPLLGRVGLTLDAAPQGEIAGGKDWGSWHNTRFRGRENPVEVRENQTLPGWLFTVPCPLWDSLDLALLGRDMETGVNYRHMLQNSSSLSWSKEQAWMKSSSSKMEHKTITQEMSTHS